MMLHVLWLYCTARGVVLTWQPLLHFVRWSKMQAADRGLMLSTLLTRVTILTRIPVRRQN
jgi:hypothetical protein